MVDFELLARGVLTLLRVFVFGLSLGITLISFQAYRQQQTERLQFAFVGFAFISMGVAVSTVITRFGSDAEAVVLLFLEGAETVPFIVGFSMLYLSLYR
ncbi:DUF7521 family protein [Halovenus salina]|uniref:DUF7521 family protein n=1 Tax=Halovenus salina TaxID=1510225 RepID=UPI002260865C|nr:hypothetical protein [Halovenus salina]